MLSQQARATSSESVSLIGLKSKESMRSGMNVLLIDDHQIYLDGLSMSLSLMEGVDHVYQATCLEEAEALLQSVVPDVILLDLNFPTSDGFHIMSYLDKALPETPVIILSGSDQPEDVRLSLSRGAKDFLSKSANGEEIRQAVRRVFEGESLTSCKVESPIGQERKEVEKQVRTHLAKKYGITPRQSEVLVLLGEGLSNKLICRRLELTEATVKFHLKALFLALDVHNRTECVAVARRLNILI
jgi:DNA-binding NarL/FixJ family response regulator